MNTQYVLDVRERIIRRKKRHLEFPALHAQRPLRVRQVPMSVKCGGVPFLRLGLIGHCIPSSTFSNRTTLTGYYSCSTPEWTGKSARQADSCQSQGREGNQHSRTACGVGFVY